jgi:hypothetical protein
MAHPKPIPSELLAAINAAGYGAYVKAIRHVRGWPQPSSRPYQLVHCNGSHISSHPTIESLERAFRARAGC